MPHRFFFLVLGEGKKCGGAAALPHASELQEQACVCLYVCVLGPCWANWRFPSFFFLHGFFSFCRFVVALMFKKKKK